MSRARAEWQGSFRKKHAFLPDALCKVLVFERAEGSHHAREVHHHFRLQPRLSGVPQRLQQPAHLGQQEQCCLCSGSSAAVVRAEQTPHFGSHVVTRVGPRRHSAAASESAAQRVAQTLQAQREHGRMLGADERSELVDAGVQLRHHLVGHATRWARRKHDLVVRVQRFFVHRDEYV